MSSSIDSVTASFAASLALAEGGRALDLGKIGGGPVRRSSQVFLLGKPLTRRPVDAGAFKAHFKRTWVVSRSFQIQERTIGLFLFSFESERDRKKVLRGGVWCFDRVPVCFAAYDGIAPMASIPIKSLLMWVVVSEIPPLYEEPENFRLIGNLLGGFVDYDSEEKKKNGIVKILFQHDLSKSILLERKIMLDVGIEPVLRFEFLHLQGRCSKCGLVTHVGAPCAETPMFSVACTLNFGGVTPPSTYAFKAGAAVEVPAETPPSSVSASPAVRKKPTVLRRKGSSSSAPDTEGHEHEVVTPVEGQVNSVATELETSPIISPSKVSKKRNRGGGLSPSPKKFKTVLGSKPMVLRPESLGLVEIEDGEETLISFKKKLGRPYGSKNKVTQAKVEKDKKKKKVDTMRPTFPVAKAVNLKNSPNSKGKGKI